MLQPLDAGRAEDYDSWRRWAAAEVVANAADPGRAVGYMSAIDQPLLYPSEGLLNAVQQDEALRALDAQLYGAILTCLQGPMRGAVEGRIRAQGQAYAGCLALRLLDAWFHNSVQKRRAGATRELITLNPRGKGAAAMEEFFSRYRLLLQQAGRTNVGPDAQIDILQRAAEDHPRLCSVWAAWKEAGGREPDKLLERLEESVADGLHGRAGGRPMASAWAALSTHPTTGPPPSHVQDGPVRRWVQETSGISAAASSGTAAPPRDAVANAAAVAPRQDAPTPVQTGKRCYQCGMVGHIRRECRAAPATAGAAGARQDALVAALSELVAEMRDHRGSSKSKSKKD